MAGPYKPKRSSSWWFRLVVPERHRAAVGKREIKETLGTTDINTALVKHAAKMAEVRAMFASLEQQDASAVDDRADKIVAMGFEALARSNARFHSEVDGFDVGRGLDNVNYFMLRMIGFRARIDWGRDYAAQAQREELGEVDVDLLPMTQPVATDAFSTFAHRDAVTESIAVFENNVAYQGAAFRELARAHLAARDWQAMAFEAQIVAQAAGTPLKPKGRLFEAVAERILRRLVDHRFGHWPANADTMIEPMMTAMATYLPMQGDVEPAVPRRTLTDAMAAWKKRKRIDPELPNKTADEWQGAVDRFRDLTGTEDMTAITRRMVKTFLADVAQLPSRPKRAIEELPLREQIAAAHAGNLPTLSPPTVGKHLAAIRSLLAVAVDEEWIAANPAAGLSVEGSKHTGTERDHFSDEDLRRIYTAPLMTDPDACSDTLFWILLLAPFHGSRPGEHCKLRPREVVNNDDEWVMRFRSDRKRRGASDTPELRPRRQKTEQSVRDVPIHWIVIEAGFLDWVALQIERGEQWVFPDLVADKYGDRYKYLSREINDAIRALGIQDPDKSFYSTRHNFKREGRRRRVSEHDLDQMAGHASLNVGRKYGQGSPIDALKESIDRLEFRSVPWDAVVACAHKRLLLRAEQPRVTTTR
ncbi:DUF6538 domain-containing protein [Sphingomonas antarctica]|uniref:DUF6538 domain-containing protein n=1 Tax=Sphingomonas antarctica TaxID=2040274 RepID=UPI0039EBA2CD